MGEGAAQNGNSGKDQRDRPASITLHPTVEASEVGTNKAVQNLRAFEAKVDVLAPGTQPLISCFFFTH